MFLETRKYTKLKFLLLFVSYLSYHFNVFSSETVKISDCNEQNESWITIFVHGITKTPWSFSDLLRIKLNKIENSVYMYAAQYLRENREYHLTQPMQEIGLKRIELEKEKKREDAATAIAHLYDIQYPNQKNYYYTYGWPGLMSKEHREIEGKKLLRELINEVEKLKNLNINPKIRFVSYSHGGNVTLNIAKDLSCQDLPLIIDELILIGTPIQKETDYLINHPIFKKVYNFYSEADVAQIADFLTTSYGFSKRKFKNRRDFKLPDKLIQVKLQTTKIVHDKKGKFIRQYYSEPKHMELWSFGWAPRIYRCSFPLFPLSTSSILPLIINCIECNDEISNDVTINIIPKKEVMILKDNCTKCKYATIFSNTKFEELKCTALEYKVDYTYCEHFQMIKDAFNYAYQQRVIEKDLRKTC